MTGTEQEHTEQYIVVGKISTAHGIKGWVKIHSFTDPMDNILYYQPWSVRDKEGWKKVIVDDGRVQGKNVVAHIEGVDDRDSAEQLRGREIAIKREQLPKSDVGEFYWVDLIGLQVINQQGIMLGKVDHIMETGAHDVLVIKGEKERLLPYVMDEFIKEVDLKNRKIFVDWDADY
jgi:16S rRNA processing protein RimM